MPFWWCRQGLVGRHRPLAQLLGWRQRAVAPMGGLFRTLSRGLEPGDRETLQPSSRPSACCVSPRVADIPEHLGVAPLLLSNAFGEGGPFASHPASPPFHVLSGARCTFVAGANDNLLRMLTRYSRSAGDSRR